MYNLQLQRLRKEAGYVSQEAFSKEIGIAKRKYESWEREEVALKLKDACFLAEKLGCSIDELAGREIPKVRYKDKEKEILNEGFEALSEQGKSCTVEFLKFQLEQNPKKEELSDYQIQGIA